ncbi:MXAN_6640 family putative metalloprotease [Bacteroidota bacterium]
MPVKNLIYIIFIISIVLQSNAISETFTDIDTKCGTFASQDEQNKLLSRILIPIDTIKGRPTLQKDYLSSSGFFLIHYDTVGFHAVQLTDEDGNGIPDYVDSAAYYFDLAYRAYIDTMGYNPPFKDDGLGGSDAYDIYLMNIGEGEPAYYGVTREDVEKLPRQHFPRWVSHIIIDNDFSPLDSTGEAGDRRQHFSTFGIDALKITAVHEFHHALQFTYGLQELPQTLIINEMTSTWMEYRLFPEIKDYFQYVKTLFIAPEKNPFGGMDYRIGYRWSIFGQYIYRNYGDSLLLRMWELVGEGINAYEALDNAFFERGSDLKEEWCNFLPWLYYTGSRAIEDKYFDDAKLFPEFSFYRNMKFSSPAVIEEGITQSFEVRAYRCILPSLENDSLDMIIANIDLLSAVRQYDSNKDFNLIFSTRPNEKCEQIVGTKYFYGVNAPEGNICDKTFFTISNPISVVYPNPFNLKTDKVLNIPVSSDAVLYEIVVLKIFSSDMIEQFSVEKSIIANEIFRNGITT